MGRMVVVMLKAVCGNAAMVLAAKVAGPPSAVARSDATHGFVPFFRAGFVPSAMDMARAAAAKEGGGGEGGGDEDGGGEGGGGEGGGSDGGGGDGVATRTATTAMVVVVRAVVVMGAATREAAAKEATVMAVGRVVVAMVKGDGAGGEGGWTTLGGSS